MLLLLFAPKLQITACKNCKIQWAVALLNIPRLTKAEIKQRGSRILISTAIVFWLFLWYLCFPKFLPGVIGHLSTWCHVKQHFDFDFIILYQQRQPVLQAIELPFMPVLFSPWYKQTKQERSTPEVKAICILLSYTLTVNITSEQSRDLLQHELFRAREEWTQMQSSANMGMTKAAVSSGPTASVLH